MHSKLILNKQSSLIMVIKLCPGATAHLYITGASVRDLSYYQAFSCFQCWVFLRGNKLALSATSQETALSYQRNLADYFYLFKPRIRTCVLRITVLFVLFHSFLFQYNHKLQLCSFFFFFCDTESLLDEKSAFLFKCYKAAFVELKAETVPRALQQRKV